MALLLCSMTIILNCVQSQVCLWNRKSDRNNTFLNGNYVDSGSTYGGQPTYRKNEFGLDLYLAFYDPNWIIHVGVPPSGSYYATCTTTNTNVDAGCSGNWDVAGDTIQDSAVTTTYETCPVWDCDELTVSGTGTGSSYCDQTFDVKVAPNQYSNAAGTRFFYFYRPGFKWICGNQICTSPWSCGGIYKREPDGTSWTSAVKPSNPSIELEGTPSPTPVPVQCVAVPTPEPSNSPTTKAPTKDPTNPPTTKAPSGDPTQSPSKDPTGNPTTAMPSKGPTDNPTTAMPSKNPTASPSSDPSKSPSSDPSTSPTNQPSTSPSNDPSSTPTKAPSGNPSASPSKSPSISPTNDPSTSPTNNPSKSPTDVPSGSPSKTPSESPSQDPSTSPSNMPSTTPTITPSKSPSLGPSTTPSKAPSRTPTAGPSDAPSRTPTMGPSDGPTPPGSPSVSPSTPTDIPTNYPSQDPSFSPSKSPSTSPSSNPSISPSMNPSISPSLGPSITPSIGPTGDPSATPSNSPSTNPSSSPSSMPSLSPSSSPSRDPTPAPTGVDFDVIATWSSTYLSIIVNIMNNDPGSNNIELKYNGNQDTGGYSSTCGRYFDDNTMDTLGDSSRCVWQVNTNIPTHQDDIAISLSFGSLSPPNIYLNSSLTLRPGAFEYRYLSTPDWIILNESITIPMIYSASDPVKPEITTTVKTLLGICDSLIIDASATTNLGERPADYYWELIGDIIDPNDPDIVLYNKSIITDNDQIYAYNEIAPGTDLMLYLNVTSWFGEESYQMWEIEKSDKPQPQIDLSGPTVFSISNENYAGIIILTGTISFNDTCIQNKTADLPYRLDWDATCNDCDNIDELNNYLSNLSVSNDKVDRVAILSEDYLQVGSSYSFTITMNCVEELVCSTSETLTIEYVYSDIECQIANGDVFLGKMTKDQFTSYNTLYLDGNTFTFDPDGGKDHLQWEWDCLQTDYYGSDDCSAIIFDSANRYRADDDNSVYIHFGENITIEYEQTYQFLFTMRVWDQDSNETRTCETQSSVIVQILDQASNLQYISLLIKIVSPQRVINVEESLRLISSFEELNENDDFSLDDATLVYKWSEDNGYLTEEDLEELNTNNDDTNLVITGGQLLPGIYIFTINIGVWLDDKEVGAGSGSIQIEIRPGPFITYFEETPDCSNVTLFSLEEAFQNQYTLNVKAESDYNQLSYGFSHSQYYDLNNDGDKNDSDDRVTAYLQNQLLNTGELSNVILPIGMFDINAHVYDPTGTGSIKSNECNIQIIDSYDYGTDCLSYKRLYNDYLNVSNIRQPYAINQFIISSSMLYIDYITMEIAEGQFDIENDDQVINCITEMLHDTLDVIHDTFGIYQNSYCREDYSVQLSSLMKSWFDLRKLLPFIIDSEKDEPYNDFRKDVEKEIKKGDLIDGSLTVLLFEIQSIIIQTFDPCLYITDHVDKVQRLSVAPESVVTTSRTIYYQRKDITSKLSPFLLEYSKYSEQLYAFASSTINFLAEIAEIDQNNIYLGLVVEILDLIEKALYIAELSKISISIAGEYQTTLSPNGEFEINSIRTGTTSKRGVNVTVHDIDILITQADLLSYLSECENDENQALCNVDVITIGLKSNKKSVRFEGAQVGIQCEQWDGIGTIGTDEVDITIVGQGNETRLDNNVTMIFYTNYDEDDPPICAWYVEDNDTWSTEGCFVVNFDIETGEVICQCNHLTTFATIHALHSNEGNCPIFTDEWHFISLFFSIFFIILIAYILSQIYPFCKKGMKKHLIKEKSLLVFLLITVVSIVNILICCAFYILENAPDAHREGIIYYTTILLNIPLFIYFVIFSLILYSWALVAHSLQVQDEIKLKFRLKLALYSSLTIISLALIGQFIMLPLGYWHDVYHIASFIWCGFLLIAALLYSIYGFLMTRLLVRTAIRMRNVVKTGAGSDMSLARKLLISAICIWLFFMLELAINFVLAFDVTSFGESIWFRLGDLSLNFFCLAIICYMYHSSIARLREIHKAPSCCDGTPKHGTIASRTKTSKPNATNLKTAHGKYKSNASLPRPSEVGSKTETSIASLNSNAQSATSPTITAPPSTIKRKKMHKQISAVTITEYTEMTNLRGQEQLKTHMVMQYDRNHSINQSSLAAPRLSGLSGLGANQSWDADANANTNEDDVDDSHINGSANNNGYNSNAASRLPEPQYDEQYAEDDDYEYEYYDEEEEEEEDPNVENGLPQFHDDNTSNLHPLQRHMALSSTSNVSIPPPVPQTQRSISAYNEEDYANDGFQTQANILYAD